MAVVSQTCVDCGLVHRQKECPRCINLETNDVTAAAGFLAKFKHYRPQLQAFIFQELARQQGQACPMCGK